MKISRMVGLCVSFLLVWGAAVTAAHAQGSVDDEDSTQQLHYADDTSTPKNSAVVDLNGLAGYTDNVFSDNARRLGAMVYQGGVHLGIDEERERSSLSLDYNPEFLFYSKVSGYNQINQSLRFGAKYDVTQHFDFRFQDTGYYFTGIYSPTLNEYATTVGGGLPGALNHSVFAPLARQLSNEARLDAEYQMSRRSNFDFFGSLGTRNFSGNSSPSEYLFNTQALSGGLTYTYRLSADITIGAMGMHQNLRFGNSLDRIESGFLTFAWQGDQGLSFSVYGGPQYTRLDDSIFIPIDVIGIPESVLGQSTSAKWDGGGGATIGWHSHRTAIQGSVQRLSSDGGGLFTSVLNSSENVNVRHHLARNWDLLVDAGNAESKALSALYDGAGLRDQTGSLKFERQLSNRLVVQVGYEADRQRVIGSFPLLVDMNRNYVTLGVFYRLDRIPLGR